MIAEMLSRLSGYSGTYQLYGESAFADTVRTGLPWSDMPNAACFAGNRKYLYRALENDNIRTIFLSSQVVVADKALKEISASRGVVLSSKAEELFYLVHNAPLHRVSDAADVFVEPFVHPTAEIHETAVLAKNVHIAEHVTVGPYAVLHDNTVVGAGTRIGSHVVVGEDGLFPRIIQGKKTHIVHFGGVRIGKDVRIQAQSTVASAVYHGGFTVVGDECHLGFGVSIGHDACVGDRCTLSSKALIAGRTQVSSDCWIGAGALVSNSLHLGEAASVKIGAVVVSDVADGKDVSGNFAVDHKLNIARMVKKK